MTFIIKKRLLLLVFTLLFFNEMKAQHPYFYTINDENSLPSNEVYQVLQDSFGFMWIGCDAGLYRYDGFKFMPYTHSQQNSNSLSNLILDKNQNIWCQNFTGQIFKTNANKNSLEIVYDASRNSKMAPIYTVDAAVNAWIVTDSLLLVLDKFQQKIKTIPTKSLGSEISFWFDIKLSSEQTIYMTSYSDLTPKHTNIKGIKLTIIELTDTSY